MAADRDEQLTEAISRKEQSPSRLDKMKMVRSNGGCGGAKRTGSNGGAGEIGEARTRRMGRATDSRGRDATQSPAHHTGQGARIVSRVLKRPEWWTLSATVTLLDGSSV